MIERTKIIGLEGGRVPDASFTLTYGTPALSKGDDLINPVTRSVSNMSRWLRIVEDGHAISFPFRENLPERFEGMPICLLVTRAEFLPFFYRDKTNVIEKDRLFTIAQDGPWAFTHGIIFPSSDACRTMRNAVAADIRKTVDNIDSPEYREALRRAAKILDPWEGMTQEEYIRLKFPRGA